MVGQILGCALCGYFAVASLLNVRATRSQNAIDSLGQQAPETTRFLRAWLCLNFAAFALMASAALVVWFDWQVALVLAFIPVLLFALTSLIMGPPTAKDS